MKSGEEALQERSHPHIQTYNFAARKPEGFNFDG
jgi:hypothetical protein